MSIETEEDIAQRQIEYLERLHHDATYETARRELHETSSPTKMRNLNTVLLIREAQIKEEGHDE